MKTNLSKKEIQTKIKETFNANPTQKEIKKIKRLAMSKNIRLKEYKKKFCKNCLTYFTSTNSTIRIKKPYKRITCKNCNNMSRYHL